MENFLKVFELCLALGVIAFAEREFLRNFMHPPVEDQHPTRNRIITVTLFIGFGVFGGMLVPWTISVLNT